jgi:hypothetical protein
MKQLAFLPAIALIACFAHGQTSKPASLFRDPASQFIAPTLFFASAGAYSIAAADFNGDGKPDLATAGAVVSNNKISILLNNGDGTLTQTSILNVTGAGYLFTADLNGDGKADLIATNYSTSGIQVLLGKGDGTFESPVSYPTAQNPFSVVIGDFNGDGYPDLIVEGNKGYLSLLLNKGNGTFGTTIQLPFTALGEMAAGDFNKDGKLDLAATNASQTTGAVSIYLGNGDGTFQSPVSYATGYGPSGIAVADLNHDGNLDLIVDDFGVYSTGQSGDIAVLLGNGDGTFRPASFYSAGGNPYSLTLGDFNGDGNVGVAVIDGSGPDLASIFVLFGNPDGTLQQPAASYALRADTLVAIDLNGDGKTDLVYCTFYIDPVGTVLNAGNHTFNAASQYFPPGYASDAAVADFNGDGNLDTVSVGKDFTTQIGMVTILLGHGDGTFPPTGTHSFDAGGNSPYQVKVADLNGDGKLDLVVSQYQGAIHTFTGNGDGTFTAKGGFGTKLGGLFAVGDFNGDGIPDIAALTVGGNLQIFFGNGDATFRTGPTTTLREPAYGINAADFNRDGKMDLEFDGRYGNFFVALGNGDGTFAEGGLTVLPYYFTSTIITDFNHDGIPDIGWTGTGAYCDFLIPGGVGYLLGNGDGTFAPSQNFTDGFSCGAGMTVGDFNSDGTLDIALTGGGSVGLMLGKGSGFQYNEYYVAGYSGGGVVGDFNNDGAPDFLTLNSGAVTILLNATGVRTTLVSSVNPSSSGQPVTFTATVAATAAFQPIPTGTITFKDGNQTLGTANLSSGKASFTTSTLRTGKHSISATYSGDGNFVPGYAASLLQTVN